MGRNSLPIIMVLNITEQDFLRTNAVCWCILIPILAIENILCLFAVSSRKRWKSPDVLLFSFILAHFITLLIPISMYTLLMLLSTSWISSTCKLLVWSVMSLRIVNSLQIAYLSMDRVWTLKWPSSYRIHNTAKQSARTAMFIWIFSIAISTIPMLGWPVQTGNFDHCSLILKVAGYGFSVCIVVIILGSFVISSTCVVTILINVILKNEMFESHLDGNITKQIPEIVIESETGEKSEHVPVSRERQNKQIYILVAVVVITFYAFGDLPFVVINIVALMTPTNPAWMPVVIVWSSLVTILLHPLLFCILSLRYRRGYHRRLQGVGVGCGCLDTQRNENGITRQDTIDSLDMFDNDDDDEKIVYPVADPAGFGFTQSMELDDPPEYEITPSIEGTRTSSAVVVRFQKTREENDHGLEFDNIGYKTEENEHYRRDENEDVKQKRKHQTRMSSRERRAQFHEIKSFKTEKRVNDMSKPKSVPSRESDSHSKNRHRKIERLSKSRGSEKTLLRQENVHTSHVDVENGDNLTVKANGSPYIMVIPANKAHSTSRSHSSDTKIKDKLKEANSYDLTKNSTSLKSERPSSNKTSFSLTESAPRGCRLDAIRERMLSEMSSGGSGELYDIPEDPAEDSIENSHGSNILPYEGSLTSEAHIQISGESLKLEQLNVSTLKSFDSQEMISGGGNKDISHRRLTFQFSDSDGKSEVDTDFSFPVLQGSVDTGNIVPKAYFDTCNENNVITDLSNHYQTELEEKNSRPESISKSSAKEMRKMYKNSKTGNALLHTTQAETGRNIVYL